MTGRRREQRRRFLRRQAPLLGKTIAVHQWNGDAYRSRRELNAPMTVDVAGPDGVWHRLSNGMRNLRWR